MEQEHDLNGGGLGGDGGTGRPSLKIDRYGLTRRRLVVLVALGQLGAMSKGRMADFAGCGLEELEKFVMPALLVATTDDPAMVVVTNKGYAITRRGLEELDRRGIPHRGEEVVAEGGQRLDFGSYDPDDFGVEVFTRQPDDPSVEPKRKNPSLRVGRQPAALLAGHHSADRGSSRSADHYAASDAGGDRGGDETAAEGAMTALICQVFGLGMHLVSTSQAV